MSNFSLDKLVGMTEADAVAKIIKAGFKARVVSRDGVGFMGTMDARPDRVKYHVENNLVTKAYIG